MALGGLGGVLPGGRGGGLLAGVARIDIRPDLSNFGPKLKTELKGALAAAGKFDTADLEKSFLRVGGATAALGKTLSKNLTLPIAGVGAVAFKMGADFDAVFARMVGLAGVATSEVDGLRQSVLDLAGETGRAPAELAESLYLIRSAGQDGQAALDLLEISAKASAAGMGETQQIASALTAALNAYAEAGLTAAEAGDVLAAAVRFGAAEADAFGQVIGTVAPLAAQLGVSFDQTAASIAAMTRVGIDTDTAATNLTAVFAGLLRAGKAGSQADKALRSVGLTAAGLRDDLGGPQGVLDVLRQLDEAFGGDEAAMQSVFPEIRALRGVLGLLAQNAEEVDEVFAGVRDSTGDLDVAFEAMAATAQFKLNKAIAQAKIALVELGEAVAPIGVAFLGAGSALVGFVSDLPGPLQKATLAFGGLLAAAGPLAFVGGKIASSFGHIIGAAKGANNALVGFRIGLQGVTDTVGGRFPNAVGRGIKAAGGLGVALGGVGAILGVGVLALNEWQNAKEAARQRVVAFTEALRADAGELGAHTRALIENSATQGGLLPILAKLSGHLSSGRSALDVYTDAALGSKDAQNELRAAVEATGTALPGIADPLTATAKTLAGSLDDARKATEASKGSTRAFADITTELAAAQQKVLDLGASGTASAKDLADAQKRVADLTKERDTAQQLLVTSTDDVTAANERQRTGLETLQDEHFDLLDATDAAAAGTASVAAAQAALADIQADAAGVGPRSIDAANRYNDALDGVTDAASSAADAQEALNESREDAADFEGPTSARIRELERTNIVQRLTSNPQEARDKEADLLKFDQEVAEKREDFQDNIADAEQRVADAADKVGDAQGKVAEAAEARKLVQVQAAKEIAAAERDVRTEVLALVDALDSARENNQPLEPWLTALREIDRLAAPGTPLRAFLDAIMAKVPAAPWTETASLNTPPLATPAAAPTAAPTAAPSAADLQAGLAFAAAQPTVNNFNTTYNLPPAEQELKRQLEILAEREAMRFANRGRR